MSEEWLSVINGNEVSSKGRADAERRADCNAGGRGRGRREGPVTHLGVDDEDDDDEDVWSRWARAAAAAAAEELVVAPKLRRALRGV